MTSRALILAAVLLLVGSFTTGRALAQENLDAGKSASQLFAGTCSACHKSPRGLLKTVSPSSLPGFLRQHYTTSPNMAGALASYLVSNGATDARAGGDAPKGAKGAKEAKEGAKEGAKEAAREAKQEARPVEQLDRWGHRVHPGGAPQEAGAPAEETKPEAESAAPVEHAGKMLPKQKLSKRGKPGEALPKEEPTAAVEPRNEPKGGETATREEIKPESKPEAAKPTEAKPAEAKPAEAKPAEAKPAEAKPAEPKAAEPKPAEPKPAEPKPADEGRSQSAKIEQPAESPAVRPDPVPQVTPASPAATPAAAAPSPPAAAPAQPAPAQAATSPAPVTEMAVPLPAAAVPPPAPAVTASAPPQPPVAPAGPPVPPISQ